MTVAPEGREAGPADAARGLGLGLAFVAAGEVERELLAGELGVAAIRRPMHDGQDPRPRHAPDAVARVLHGARAPPRQPPPGQLVLLH